MSTEKQLLSLSSTMTLLVVAFVSPVLVSVVVSEATLPPSILHLQRITSFPSHQIDMDSIGTHDRLRHSWMSQQQSVNGGKGVVDFPLQGTDPFGPGFYVTKIKLGSSPKEFNMLIDTGSDVPWVVCNSCITCPQTNE